MFLNVTDDCLDNLNESVEEEESISESNTIKLKGYSHRKSTETEDNQTRQDDTASKSKKHSLVQGCPAGQFFFVQIFFNNKLFLLYFLKNKIPSKLMLVA